MTKPEEQTEEVQRQQKFVQWLKDNGLYNPFESAGTMCRMQDVWVACGEPTLVNTNEA